VGEFRRGVVICTADGADPLVPRNAAAALARACDHLTVIVPTASDVFGSHGHSAFRIVRVPPVPGMDRACPAVAERSGDVVITGRTAEALARLSHVDERIEALRREFRRPPLGTDASGASGPSDARRRNGSPPSPWLGDDHPPAATVSRGALDAYGAIGAARMALLHGTSARHGSAVDPPGRRYIGRPAWRRSALELEALEVSFGPALQRADPDIVLTLDLGALVVSQSVRRRGPCSFWLAHLPAAMNESPELESDEHDRLVRRWIASADAVIDASDGPGDRSPVLLNLPLRLRSTKARGHSVRTKAKLDPSSRFMVCHLGQVAPLSHVPQLLDILIDLPDLRAVVLGRDLAVGFKQLKIDAESAGVLDRVHPVKAPDPDFLERFLSDATIGVHLGVEDADHVPATIVALAVARRPVVVHPTSPLAPLVGGDLEGVVASDDGIVHAVRKALDAAGAEGAVPTPPSLRWETQSHRLLGQMLPEPVPDGAAPAQPSLLIGPRNGNGQASAWARALRTAAPHLKVQSFAAKYSGLGIDDPVDHLVPLSTWKAQSWQVVWARYAMAGFSHVLLEQALTLTGTLNGLRFFEDVETLREHGMTVGLVFRGSEIRNPARHAQRERWSPFSDPEDPFTAKLQRSVASVAPHVASFSGSKFVTTLDLLDDVPGARWLPQVLDLSRWRPGPPPMSRRTPVVLHAPSNERLKGSQAVDSVCRALAERGLIEYRRLHGVPYREMPAALRGADIVLDQFALGSYGVLALQAMACGRTVVGHVSPVVRARVGRDLPVVEATCDDLADVLAELLDSPAAAGAVADAGRSYVEEFHDGRYAGQVLCDFLAARDASPPSARPEARHKY
jgi:glycosyltransferase involved in cell wall biosynthesis